MRKLLIITVFCVSSICSRAQIINQDASGKSPIVTPGTSINFNVTEAQIQGTHYGQFGGNSSHDYIYGIDIAAKNATGIGNVFDAGKFTPGGTLSLLFGYRFIKIGIDKNRQDYQAVLKEVVLLRNTFGPNYLAEVTRSFAVASVPHLTTAEIATLSSNIQDLDMLGIENLPQSLTDYKPAGITDVDKLADLTGVIQHLITFVNNRSNELDSLRRKAEYLRVTKTPDLIKNQTHTIYLRGGASANQFTYDMGNTFKDYNKRFMDTTANTYYFELGYTGQYKKNFWGIDIGYARQSNMSTLTDADYTYNYQDTSVTSGKLTKQKAFTAYSGTFGFYQKLYINIDYQGLIAVDVSKYIGIGPYLRYNHNFKADGLAKDATVFGVGMNYINGNAGTFLGGIYLQSSDISGKSEPNFGKSIQFGVIAKFNLGSIFLLKQ